MTSTYTEWLDRIIDLYQREEITEDTFKEQMSKIKYYAPELVEWLTFEEQKE